MGYESIYAARYTNRPLVAEWMEYIQCAFVPLFAAPNKVNPSG